MTESGSDAEILHQGFRSFQGEREGLWSGMRSIIRVTVRALLGLGRGGGAKVLPILTGIWAVVPALVYMGVLILVNLSVEDLGVDLYAGYYGQINTAIVIFVAFVAPVAMLGDRQGGLLVYYFSSRLTRGSYLASKAIAILQLLLMVTILPLLFLLIGYSFQGVGPDGVDGMLTQLTRILVGGAVVAVFFTAVSMAASSLADKRLYASVGLVLLLVALPITAAVLTEEANVTANIHLLNPFLLPLELVHRVYGEIGEQPDIETASLVAAWAAWVVVGFGFTFWRYRKLAVTR